MFFFLEKPQQPSWRNKLRHPRSIVLEIHAWISAKGNYVLKWNNIFKKEGKIAKPPTKHT